MRGINCTWLYIVISIIVILTARPSLAAYMVKDIGSLGGGYVSIYGVNDDGMIVGASTDATGRTFAYIIVPEDTDSDGKPDTWNRDVDGNGVNDLMVNLGTFGGEMSRAVDINQSGMVTGTANDKWLNYPQAFLIIPEDSNSDGVPDTWYRDTDPADGINDLMQDLGSLGGSTSNALAINDHGEVTGRSAIAAGGPWHAFVYTPGTGGMRDLGTLGGDSSEPTAINNEGCIIGWATDYLGGMRAFIWTPDEGMGNLGSLGGYYSYTYAYDINDRGQVVGESEIYEEFNPPHHAFLLTPEDTDGNGVPDMWYRDTDPVDGINDLMVDLGTNGADTSFAHKINELGQVIGNRTISNYEYAFFWENGNMTDIWTIDGFNSFPSDINNAGQVVGSIQVAEQSFHAYVWDKEEGLTDIGTEDDSSWAYNISNIGLITGFSRTGTQYHGLLWENVLNTPPEVVIPGSRFAAEGSELTVNTTFTDAETEDTHTATIDWGDGTPVEAATVYDSTGGITGLVEGSHAYAENGVYGATVSVTDDKGGSSAVDFTVTVSNVAPIVDAGKEQIIKQNETAVIIAGFSDPGVLDTHTATIDWGDGTLEPGVISESGGNGRAGGRHNYQNKGIYAILVTVYDDDGGVGADYVEIKVGLDEGKPKGKYIGPPGPSLDAGGK